MNPGGALARPGAGVLQRHGERASSLAWPSVGVRGAMPGAAIRLGPTAAGLLFGVALWVLAQTVAVPLLGWLGDARPAPGVLAWRLGPGAAIASLVAHLAYGGTLGWVYGCHGGGGCAAGRVR
jgi:hypothetical protein